MKKLLYLFMVLILVSCGSEKAANISTDSSKVALNAAKQTSTEASSMKISAQSIISQMEKGKYKEGELLVKFKSGIIGTSSLKLHQAVGASVSNRFTVVPNLEHVKLPAGVSVKDAILQYMSDPNVEYAEPNYIIGALDRKPNDTYFGNQWALLNTGSYANGTPGADISAPKAWDISTGSSSIVVAVLDTGIDYNHPDLVGNIWTNPGEVIGDENGDGCPGICGVDDDGDGKVDEDSLGRQPGGAGYTNDLKDDDDENGYIDDYKGWNFVGDNNDPMDDNGHGTHVAGIIGAVGDNGTGVAGVMWNVKLLPLKIMGADGTGNINDLIAAINYAVLLKNKGVNIKAMNASIGTAAYSQSFKDAIASANTAEILFIAAAGNGGGPLCGDGNANNNDLSPCYPASYNLPNIISVAATDQNDRIASFSNYGPTTVHVAAPGVYVLSTIPHDAYLDKDFNLGTSMAAPHVSGLAGLLFSYYDGNQNTKFDYSKVRNTILRCVDKKETLEGWIQKGGRINAYKAVASLLTPTNLSATATSPNQVSLSWSANATCEAMYKVERKTGEGDWEVRDTLQANSSSYIDDAVSPDTAYTYRVTAFNDISESFISNWQPVTTPKPESGGGGDGCTIGAKQNTLTAMADTAMLLIPLLVIALMRRRR